MATYVPPKRATAYRFYVSLVSQANTKIMQVNPTLASGDATVSKDGGAFANLTTLPAVTPAGGVAVQVDLSATEMTADNVVVRLSDASGAEWCDLVVNIQTAARQVDDLAYPATSGRSMVVDAAGLVDANTVTNLTNLPAITANWLTAAGIAADAITAAKIADGAIDTATFASGATVPRVTLVDTLTTYTGNTPQTGDSYARIGAAGAGLTDLATAANLAIVAGYLDTEIAAIKAKTDQLVFTVANRVDSTALALGTTAKSEVNAEVLDVLNVDTLVDGKTFVQYAKIIGAVVGGKISGAGTGTEIFLGLDGATTRVTVTVDSSGNRSAVVYG